MIPSTRAIESRALAFWHPVDGWDHAALLQTAQEKNETLTEMRRQLRSDRKRGEFPGDLPPLIERLEESAAVDWAVLEDWDTARQYGHHLQALAEGGKPDMHSSIGKYLVKHGYLTRREVGRGSSKRVRYTLAPRGVAVVRRYSEDAA